MLLGFDTATPRVTVALADGDDITCWHGSGQVRHAEELAPGIDHVLAAAGRQASDLTQIAVGVGPGPFTGLRVGLVAARTMAAALGVELVGVCTLDIVAAEAGRGAGIGVGVVEAAELAVATDARRKEIYWASYREGVRCEGPSVIYPADAPDLPTAGAGPVLYPDAFSQPLAPQYPDAAALVRGVLGSWYELLPAEPLYLRRPDAAVPGPPKATS